jgi:hypothetical protein
LGLAEQVVHLVQPVRRVVLAVVEEQPRLAHTFQPLAVAVVPVVLFYQPM